MTDDSHVQQLLDEILDLECTPEQVCGDCPELLPEVRKRWQQLRIVEAELEALFPTPAPRPDADTPAPWHPNLELPRIPGYEVEAVLGRGGMGVVYKARHLRLNRPVALKMLLAGTYAGRPEKERFALEAAAVAGLRHANIVQVHDVGDHDGRPYFTMEYLEGGSLAQKLLGTPQPAQQAARLLATLAEAVHAAHEGGIVHRDLKPANILLTADGTPKIADFGLARHFDGGQALTLSGVRVGTPSYMAPEQAMGKAHTIGPLADIYSLGALLYELLTGRPPFRAETAAETELQVIFQEPVPPSRLNARVPRDLETICLKCLHKDPGRRYATADALAADLQRLERGEPITARRPGSLERFSKWVRRRPAAAALLAATTLFTIALASGAVWTAVQQAHRRQAIEAELRDVERLQQKAQWNDATVALQRAGVRLNGGGASDLRQRFDQARNDLDLVIELERIRLSRLTSGNLALYKSKADQRYTRAFAEAGLAKVYEPPDIVAARLQASAIGLALTAALDDWAVCTTDRNRRAWLLAVARAADPDPHGWRDRIRDPASWDKQALLTELAQTMPLREQPVSLLLALGERLGEDGGGPALLKRVQNENPADFWANLILGDSLVKTAPVEAGGYYRAALASRPEAAVGYTALGDALNAQKLPEEATRYYSRAVKIDPQYARGHTNLGNILNAAGHKDDAIACYRRALEVDPDYAWAHYDLANTLRDAGRRDEAFEHYRRFHELDPSNTHVTNILRADLVWRGQGEEVRREWKKALEADPPEHEAWFGYAELCLFLGDEAEYRRARQDLLRRFGTSSNPGVAERTARTILLLPAAADELQVAAALAERAVAAKATTAQWIYPYFLFAHGLAEYRQGRFDSAISIMRGDAATVMGPAPRIVVAMAEYRQGQKQEARKTLAAAIAGFDWSAAQVGGRDDWIWHVLRREGEAMIFPNTAAFLEGRYQPKDNIEGLALLGVCRFKNLNSVSARLYAEAFAADPQLADDLRAGHRYNAACVAALAGSGEDEPKGKLSEAERTRLRKQARAWLQADLAAWTKKLDSSTASRLTVSNRLMHWQVDRDLAGIREPSRLELLPPNERQECLALWKEVAAVLKHSQNGK
ncbi:MAG TPA: serine/threonine-protein kinase [Gemmataceae bacterium]|nr:serine/threonine-protein kinase [Gemmataceae bacterium]